MDLPWYKKHGPIDYIIIAVSLTLIPLLLKLYGVL